MQNLLIHKFGSSLQYYSQHANIHSPEGKLINTYPDYKILGMVRNPWDRLWSWYCLLHQNAPLGVSEERIRFQEFLLANHGEGPADSIFFHLNQLDYFPDQREFTFYCFENYETECRALLARFNLEIENLPIINKAREKNYLDFYTQRSKELVQQNCQRDINYFNYTF